MMSPPTKNSERRFFSLKWRILIIFSLLLLALNSLAIFFFSRNLLSQFELERKALHEMHVRELEGMMRQSSARLLSFGDIVPSMSGVGERLAAGNVRKATEAFSEHWQALQLGALVDVAQIYSVDNVLIQSWKSEDVDIPDSELIQRHIRQVNAEDRPVTFLNCVRQCTEFAVVPMLAKGKNSGVILLGATLAAGIVNFKDMSGVDIGVLNVDGGGRAGGREEERTIAGWGVHVSALTGAEGNMRLLRTVASRVPSLSRITAGVRERVGGRDFEIVLLPIGRAELHGAAHFILIDDITERMAQIRNATWRMVTIGITGMVLYASILLGVLWVPLSRLRQAALALPMLAQSAFEQVRQAVKKQTGRRWYRDEFDILDDTLVTVSRQLETLQDVSRHTIELEQANIRLEDASRMKSQFLANMSHELRTPLNAIVGFSEVLKDGLMGEMTDQQREYITDIFNSGQHLLSLINDILDLSKVEAGKMTLELEPAEGYSLFANSLSIIKEKAAAHRIRLEMDVPEGLGLVYVDPRKVKQIVYNLLSNAVKFTHDGGRVSLRACRVPCAAVGRQAGGWPARNFPLTGCRFAEFLEISVTDSGIGMSRAGLDKLFQPFSQIDSGLARKFSGTGLGLALVRLMTELHGGTVGVTSAEGLGSRFTVWLPFRTAEADVATPSEEPPAPFFARPAAGERVALVVEDDDQAAELIRLQLAQEGLTVLRAESAEAALALAERQQLALITLDILLPGIDGWEFLARIKQMPNLAHVPVVVISIVADIKKGMALNALAVLQKPVSREDLRSAMTSLELPRLSPGRVLTVLVADDDPMAVEVIAAHLLSPDYRVARAYGGREAIETARRMRPDLIILDLMMPEVSGFDVVEALADDPDTARVPLLVVTAKQITAEERALLNRHVKHVVEKAKLKHGTFLEEVRRAIAAG